MIPFTVSPKSFTDVAKEATAKKESQRGFSLKASTSETALLVDLLSAFKILLSYSREKWRKRNYFFEKYSNCDPLGGIFKL